MTSRPAPPVRTFSPTFAEQTIITDRALHVEVEQAGHLAHLDVVVERQVDVDARAFDRVVPVADQLDDRISRRHQHIGVVTVSADERIGAGMAEEAVIAIVTIERVVATDAAQHVVTAATGDDVGAAVATAVEVARADEREVLEFAPRM